MRILKWLVGGVLVVAVLLGGALVWGMQRVTRAREARIEALRPLLPRARAMKTLVPQDACLIAEGHYMEQATVLTTECRNVTLHFTRPGSEKDVCEGLPTLSKSEVLVLDADLLGDDLSARMERTTRIGDMLGYQGIPAMNPQGMNLGPCAANQLISHVVAIDDIDELQLPEELLLVKRQDLGSEYRKQVSAALHQGVEKLTAGKLMAEF
ncbi:hypothetical protein [Corallococcus sp. M7]